VEQKVVERKVYVGLNAGDGENKNKKKTYKTPRIEVLGTIRELTQQWDVSVP